MFVLRVLTPLLELSEPETHKSISVSAATTPSISIPDILLTTMKSSSTRPIATMTTSKDLICVALGMILVVVDYLIVIACYCIGISTHTTISTRIILATSTSIVKLLFDVTILNWFFNYDFELLDIIMVGFLYMLWFLKLLNIFGLLKSFELVDRTLWSVIYFVAVLIVIGQLRRQDKKKAMVQENGDGKDYFAYTLIVV